MNKIKTLIFAALAMASCQNAVTTVNELRAPAYPLVTIDPYTSAWSAADQLNGKTVTHWTGKEFPLDGFITVDGMEYRFMGSDNSYSPIAESTLTGDWESEDMHLERRFTLDSIPAGKIFVRYANRMPAKFYLNGEEFINERRKRSIGAFKAATAQQIALLKAGENVLTADCSNNRPQRILDIELMIENPGPCVCAEQTLANVQATQTHYSFICGPVQLDLCFTAPFLPDNLELASRPVNYISYKVKSLDGASHEVQLNISADAKGWCVNTPGQEVMTEIAEVPGLNAVRGGSVEQNILGRAGDDVRIDWGYLYLAGGAATKAKAEGSLLELTDSLGKVASSDGHWLVAYDDIYSVQYFEENLRPYWNRGGDSNIEEQLVLAEKEYSSLMKKCADFDRKMFAEATEKGGKQYAELCALAYRQAYSAHKLVQLPCGDIAYLSKENNSNGSIGTVDVTYPSAPVFLKYNPQLCAGLLNHIFDYSESGRWTKPFPAHDVGTYPLANGQTYPKDMPVEEGGNMLILAGAVCHSMKDWDYAKKHWDVLTVWEEYLEHFGLDPDDQLCTDDFAGPMAHNANLSVKAILGIASYAQMAGKLGYADVAEAKMALARNLALQWKEMSAADDHYSLAFGAADTWSQKYNLVWDGILGLDIFPEDIVRTELDYYPTVMGEYGLPLDNRSTYTKSDWIIWTASLTDSKDEFESLISPMWKFYNTTPDRVPMSDWYFTDMPNYCEFIARSVVGGYFIKML